MKNVLFVSLLCVFLQVACTRSSESTTQASGESEVTSGSDQAKQIEAKDKIDVQPRETDRSEYTAEQAQREVQSAQAHKESVGDDIDDAWIHAKIVTKLLADLKTSERTINVDVNKNIVTLRGAVDSPKHKLDAERIARETEGVKQVNNRLRVSKT